MTVGLRNLQVGEIFRMDGHGLRDDYDISGDQLGQNTLHGTFS